VEKMRMESVEGTERNIAKIAELFPSVITETKIENGTIKKAVNFDVLRQILAGEIAEGEEAYEFTWVGKKEALAEAGRPIRKTLRPCKGDSKNWETTKNLYIEGDNLDVLKLLQESYLGAVKMIYIDPPYNTGKDFVYRDNFHQKKEEYELDAGVFDEKQNRLFKNTETNGRYHSDWCSMIYPRLLLARNLLHIKGAIFISIDENEAANLKKIADEIFGEKNFVSNIIWQSRTSISNDFEISLNHNHTLIYAKSRTSLTFSGEPISENDYVNPDNDQRGPWKLVPIDANHAGGDTVYPIKNPNTGIDYLPPNGRIWAYNRQTFSKLQNDGRIKFGLNNDSAPKRKLYFYERMEKGDSKTPSSILLDAGTTKTGTAEIMDLFDGMKVFDYPKPAALIQRFIRYGLLEKNDIVLDFFSGSSTTAHAVMRASIEEDLSGDLKYILVQYPEDLDISIKDADQASKKTIETAINFLDILEKPHFLTEIGKERIRRAGEKIISENPLMTQTLDIGFRVFKTDESNMKDVYFASSDYNQSTLDELLSNIKEDRSDLDLLYGCLLEWGLPLSLPCSSDVFDNVTIHTVNDIDLIACFNENISEAVIREIAKRSPRHVVFRDSSFESSPAKINVEEIFKIISPKTNVKVI